MRFGDPEAQVVLPRLTSDLAALLAEAAGRRSDGPTPTFADDAAVTVVLAAEGYPASPRTGDVIDGLDAARAIDGVRCSAPASAEDDDGRLVTAGGRVLDVDRRAGPTIADARELRRYPRRPRTISWPGASHTGPTSPADAAAADTRGRARMKVAVLMGSATDRDKMAPAAETLERFGIEADVRVLSAHRNPAEVVELARRPARRATSRSSAARAWPPTWPAWWPPTPRCRWSACRCRGGALNGVDALYSTVQMPKGIPVATVAIDGAMNAALLVVQMLAITDEELPGQAGRPPRGDRRLARVGSVAVVGQRRCGDAGQHRPSTSG